MKVVGYVRVSTEEQANSGLSLAAQKSRIEAFAKLYDMEITTFIEDAGVSAKNMKRDGLQRALEMLRNGEVKGIIVSKLDRLTRSIIDFNELLYEYFSEGSNYKAHLLSVEDHIDTSSAGGRLILNIKVSFSQFEREVTGERTKAALTEKKRQGFILGRPEKKMIPNSEEHRIYQYAKMYRDNGISLQYIADRINEDGYKSPNGGKWHAKSVANLLKRGARE